MEQKYIILGIVSIVVIVSLVVIAIKLPKHKQLASNELIEALGGFLNIEKYESKISRVNIFVYDIKLVDLDAIKAITNSGLNVTNNKLQIILNQNTNNFIDYLKTVKH